MITSKELRDLYLSIDDASESKTMQVIFNHLRYQYCLLDEDGYTIYLYYNKGIAALYYENRKTGNEFLDFIGINDARLELILFFTRIRQLFGKDLSPFEDRMAGEANKVFKDYDIY